MYNVQIYKQAARYYNKLDSKTKRRINEVIDELISCPMEGYHIKKLKGRLEGKYRYEIGGLRLIYTVDVRDNIICIEAIGPRGDVYK